MNWEAISAISGIIGALGVIASLFYVAYQVKQNTHQGKLNTLVSSGDSLLMSSGDSLLNSGDSGTESARLWLSEAAVGRVLRMGCLGLKTRIM